MKLLWPTLTLVFLFVFQPLQAADKTRIATTLPISQALAESLLIGTGITPVYLPPSRLPVKRIANWLQHKSGQRIEHSSPYQAVITVESIWPRYRVYGKLRSQNIRIVPIDIARELDIPGSQISLSADPVRQQDYFWLAPDNLLVMSRILAHDLSRLWPEKSEMIHSNQQQLRLQVLNYSSQLDQYLMSEGPMAICVMSPELNPLAQALFLPIEEKGGCSDGALQLLKYENNNSENTNSQWSLDAAEKPLKSGIEAWLKMNIKALAKGLEGG
ncbi:hypothetical protein [Neptunomonas japonica]|uniref:hypothetical protein n=1 Tax=Neptunomonas japonica TaxID=417574 RepID=UPI00048DA178|nr:hypothetical protein [Neptunomonas japonica]